MSYKAGFYVMWGFVLLLFVAMISLNIAYQSKITALKAQNAELVATVQKQTEVLNQGTAALNACAESTEKWKGAALAEYDAIQKMQTRQQVDWPAILKGVAVLLK